MEELDRARIRSVIEAFGDDLEGDWLLVGGALVALWFNPARLTADIDLTPVEQAPSTLHRLRLLEAAERRGLTVETVNSAVDYFVRRIPDWAEQLEVLHRGSRATIHRPTVTLFLLLKIRRLSEEDLADCLGAIAHADAHGLAFDEARVVVALDALGASPDLRLGARRTRLRAALAGRARG